MMRWVFVNTLLNSVNASTVETWSTELTPNDLKLRWDVSVEILRQLVDDVNVLMHSKLSLMPGRR